MVYRLEEGWFPIDQSNVAGECSTTQVPVLYLYRYDVCADTYSIGTGMYG